MNRTLKFMRKPDKYCKFCGKKLDWIGRKQFCNASCVNKWHYRNKKESFDQHDKSVANEGTI